jgi:ubiquinol-cytochrome c reductase subunit 6
MGKRRDEEEDVEEEANEEEPTEEEEEKAEEEEEAADDGDDGDDEEEDEEEELVDPRNALVASCSSTTCVDQIQDYNDCVERLETPDPNKPERTCAPWFYDVRTCVDTCVCFQFYSHVLGFTNSILEIKVTFMGKCKLPMFRRQYWGYKCISVKPQIIQLCRSVRFETFLQKKPVNNMFWWYQDDYVASPRKKLFLFVAFILCIFFPFTIPVYTMLIETEPCCKFKQFTSLGVQVIVWTIVIFICTFLLWIPGIIASFVYMKRNMYAVHVYFFIPQ